METNTRATGGRLHPLLTAAAISVTVFSAVGVAAVTGLIPHTKGQTKAETPLAAVTAPAPVFDPAPASIPAPRPVKKPVAAKPAAKAVQTVAYNEYPQTQVTQAPQVIEAPKPVVKPGLHGVVESVREVEVQGDAKGVGAVGGGVAGAVLGHNIGNHNKIVTVLGTAGGALLGHHIEKKARTEKAYELTVRYNDGTTQSFQSKEAPLWHQGDRVRYYEGKLQPV